MPIGIVGDLHLGPKCEQNTIKEHVVSWYPKLHQAMLDDFRARGIKTILLSGDVFTIRPFMTIEVMTYAIHLFRDMMRDFDVHVIAGNHDYLYENKESLSSLALLELLPNVHVYRSGIEKLELNGLTWYMVPWIFPDKLPAFSDWLSALAKKPKAVREKTVLFGHFDIMDCLMEGGRISDVGLPPEKFYKAATRVISGHYHCKSLNKGKDPNSYIMYLGTPYQLSFAHVGTKCGYYVMDDDGQVEFVENTMSPRFVDVDDEHLDGLGDLSNCFVRYCFLNSRAVDDSCERKKKLNAANPLYVKPVPYGGEVSTVDEARRLDDEETRRILGSDSISMAAMYMDRYPESLPTFWSGEDPKEKILGILATYPT